MTTKRTFQEILNEVSKYDWRYKQRLTVLVALNDSLPMDEYGEIHLAMKWRDDKERVNADEMIKWLNNIDN